MFCFNFEFCYRCVVTFVDRFRGLFFGSGFGVRVYVLCFGVGRFCEDPGFVLLRLSGIYALTWFGWVA